MSSTGGDTSQEAFYFRVSLLAPEEAFFATGRLARQRLAGGASGLFSRSRSELTYGLGEQASRLGPSLRRSLSGHCYSAGSDINSKGFKVPRGVGVIQGDGINYHTIQKMLEAVMEAGYSAQASTSVRGLCHAGALQ